MSEKREQYSWQEFDKDSEKIAAWAKERHIRNIYGIPRGGLVIAVKLSHLLDLPIVLTRDDITPDTLVVDDIIDGGGTLDRLLAQIGKHQHIASLFHNPTAKCAPTFYAREKTGWVIFPWETKETSRYDFTV